MARVLVTGKESKQPKLKTCHQYDNVKRQQKRTSNICAKFQRLKNLVLSEQKKTLFKNETAIKINSTERTCKRCDWQRLCYNVSELR